jgi:hypothetical protein
MVAAQVWTLIGLLATALLTLLIQIRGVEQRLFSLQIDVSARLADLTAEMHRGFGEIRGDISVLRAQINLDGQ